MYNLVANDTRPRLNFTLKQNGVAINLTGAVVKFYFKKQGSDELKIDGRSCTVSDASNGEGFLSWQSGDLDTPGVYYGEFEITFSDTKIQTCKEKIKFKIRPEIG